VRIGSTVFPTPAHIGQALAELIADGIAATPPGSRYLLGCPSGRSPLSTYQALADEVSRRRLDLSGLVIVMMDEYLEADTLRPVDPTVQHSCTRFGRTEIVGRLNNAAGPGRGIAAENFWVPDPQDPGQYDADIEKAGGIDLFILASGASDGHIAFNPPGTTGDAGTRIVELAEQTRSDNLRTFVSFADDLARVPRRGVTVGVATIRDLSKRAVMVVHGAEKAEAVRRLQTTDRYEPDWPATILTECTAAQLFVDEAAALPKQTTTANTF
jgi:glucosamine-6-phosphate deaminase